MILLATTCELSTPSITSDLNGGCVNMFYVCAKFRGNPAKTCQNLSLNPQSSVELQKNKGYRVSLLDSFSEDHELN